VLSRELADRRIWPAIDLTASATRREELLLSPDTLGVSHKLRRDFSGMSAPEAMEQLLARMRRTKTNEDLVTQIASGRA
jgi:transcription termination factor Rho